MSFYLSKYCLIYIHRSFAQYILISTFINGKPEAWGIVSISIFYTYEKPTINKHWAIYILYFKVAHFYSSRHISQGKMSLKGHTHSKWRRWNSNAGISVPQTHVLSVILYEVCVVLQNMICHRKIRIQLDILLEMYLCVCIMWF